MVLSTVRLRKQEFTMKISEFVVGTVSELLSDDCLIVSDSQGTRNAQVADLIYLDDEVISGGCIIENTTSTRQYYSLVAEEDDVLLEVYLEDVRNLEQFLPEEILDELRRNIYNFSHFSADS